jgi:hypothetical protein
MTGARRGPDTDRVLATVLFTDIVDSTSKVAERGDAGWKELLATHRRAGARGDQTLPGPVRAIDRRRAVGHVRRAVLFITFGRVSAIEATRPSVLGHHQRAGPHTGTRRGRTEHHREQSGAGLIKNLAELGEAYFV